jgi:hypothetical protein
MFDAGSVIRCLSRPSISALRFGRFAWVAENGVTVRGICFVAGAGMKQFQLRLTLELASPPSWPDLFRPSTS